MKWYRADYDGETEAEYFTAESDEEAISIGHAKTGTMYSDVGWIPCSMVELWEIDDNTECFNAIRRVWG